jgi:hypothetical protein
MKIDFIGLELITFHDMPLLRLSIEYGTHPKFEIDISEFDNSTNEYSAKRIIFGELVNICISELSSINLSDCEIYSFDYFLQGDLLCGKMILLQGFGEASCEVEFSCRSVIVDEVID